MKEYLVNYNVNYKLEHLQHPIHGAIEIPEGADTYIKFSNTSDIFYKDDFSYCYCEEWVKTVKSSYNIEFWKSCPVLWQRHTKPEELPFVDDGDDDKPDCDSKLGNFVVDDTLSQRQSQYGEFKDVADTTQKLMSFLTGNGYTCVQLESLHMICSKLARIAHGDPNHIDSWHDIAGYATLVVNDLS